MNQHISKFLEYYIKLQVPPEYAILLSGKWGSGKTFFIDDFIKNKEEEKDKIKFINISLFGIQHIDEVKKQIFFQLYDVKKGIVSKFFSAISNVLKYKINVGIQDIPIKIALTHYENQSSKPIIFIFDDLERIGINIIEILGYINMLVEKLDRKVIILANEEKLNNKSEYKDFKEKVIGKTLQVEQDFDSAFDSFIKLSKSAKTALKNHINVIKIAFETANYNNLRNIRQSILDFERFYKNIDKHFRKNKQFINDIIMIFFAISIETKQKGLNLSDIMLIYSDISTNDNNPDIKAFFKKYDGFIKNNYLILSGKQWYDFFNNGILNKNELSESLNDSEYFISETQVDWKKLWYFQDLEDNDFQTILSSVTEKFNSNQYTNHNELLHVSGILLKLSVLGLYKHDKKYIIKQAKANIDNWANNPEDKRDTSFDPSGVSLDFLQKDTQEFKEISQYKDLKNKELEKQSLERIGKQLIDSIENNNLDKCKTILDNEMHPLLFCHIDKDKFLQALLKTKNNNLGNINRMFGARYYYDQFVRQSVEEFTFFKKLEKLVDVEAKKRAGTIKGYNLKSFKKYRLDVIIKKFEKI